ncbi:MAG: HNH endonuclease [Sedimentisphaerales bacterium]|nr:HNH endonuclease [Sedimentisphaerales bacterium]
MKQLPLTQGYFAKVDDEDYPRLTRWKWHVSPSTSGPYAARTIRPAPGQCRKRRLHYEVLRLPQPLPSGRVVDHINHDTLDCRKENLRVCTHQQNFWNSRPRARKTSSRYKGVTRRRPQKWKATIMKDGRLHNLGLFDDEYDAMVAYNRAAVKLFGDYAHVNHWRGPSPPVR